MCERNTIHLSASMSKLLQLAELIRKRNAVENEIAAILDRPGAIGHVGEYIASAIFNVTLEESASHKGNDGRFGDGPLRDRTVNIKWYTRQEGLLDITPNALPAYYLVLTGPRALPDASSRQARPWVIDSAFLFDAVKLVAELEERGTKIGKATSLRQCLWDDAEIYPSRGDGPLVLSQEQHDALALFHS